MGLIKQETIILETERLRIRPLTYEQLISYLKTDGGLEKDLAVQPLKRVITPELVEAFEEAILPSVGNPRKNYLFSTLWTLIDKADNVMVGDLCFKGEPDDDGVIEVGYGTYSQFQNKGYMTEALEAVIDWAFSHDYIFTVIAHTEKTNLPSQRIVQKNGFVRYKEDGRSIYWRKEK